jgi:hypothetical protein
MMIDESSSISMLEWPLLISRETKKDRNGTIFDGMSASVSTLK